MFDEDKLDEREAAALHHHKQCESHRRGMFDEACYAGLKFQEIKQSFFDAFSYAFAETQWVEWQRDFRRRHGVSERKIREYVQIADEWHQPWCQNLRGRGWEPASISGFLRMLRSVKKSDREHAQDFMKAVFEETVLQGMDTELFEFVREDESLFFDEYLDLVHNAHQRWKCCIGDFDTEADYEAYERKRTTLKAAVRAKRLRRVAGPRV